MSLVLDNNDKLNIIVITSTLLWSVNLELSSFNIGIHIVLILILGLINLKSNYKVNRKFFLTIFLIFVYSIIVSLINYNPNSFLRTFLSSSLFLGIITLIQILINNVKIDQIFIKKKHVKLYVMFIFLSLIIDYVSNYPLNRVGGIFLEPSHLAISIIPLLIYYFEIVKFNKLNIVITFIIILAFSFSTTFLLISFLLLIFYQIFYFKSRFKTVYFLSISIATVFILFLFSNYVSSRIIGVFNVTENANISSLVYVYGWESAYYYLIESNFLGIGLNAMGQPPFPELRTSLLLTNEYGEIYSNPDGSFLFSKVVSELGILGLILYFLVFSKIKRLLKYYSKITPELRFYFNNILVLFFASFIRGVGFFDGPFIVAIISFLIINKFDEKKIINS